MTHRLSEFTPSKMKHPLHDDLKHKNYCASVIHPTTGEIIAKYSKLDNYPETREVWTTTFGKELGSLSRGVNRTGEKCTDTLAVLTHQEIIYIPTDRVVTYRRLVVNYRPQKRNQTGSDSLWVET